jgi:hypothetical protein
MTESEALSASSYVFFEGKENYGNNLNYALYCVKTDRKARYKDLAWQTVAFGGA